MTEPDPFTSRVAGAWGPLPEGLTFEVVVSEHANAASVIALHPDAPVGMYGDNRAGHITWDLGLEEIDFVKVIPQFRRRGLATELLRRAREVTPGLRHSEILSADGTAWSRKVAGPASTGLTFVYEPSVSEYGGLVRTTPRVVAYDGEREVGFLSWDVIDLSRFDTVSVRPDYRRRGIATRLWEEAKKVNPDLDPDSSVFYTPDGKAFVDSLTRTAGPASSTVPLDRFPVLRPTHFGPRDVKVLRMAQKDIDRLPPGQRSLVAQVLEDLRAGRAQVEEKQRGVLRNTYTVRVTRSLRLGLYLSEDQPGGDPAPDWIVYILTDHDYDEAERRMRLNASYDEDMLLETQQEVHERSRNMLFLRNGEDGEDLGQVDGVTYEFQGWATTPWGTKAGRIVAYQGMSTVGSIEWIAEASGPATISSVWVARGYRRQGIATRMLGRARALTPAGVQHSTLLTEDGKAWSERVGKTALHTEGSLGYYMQEHRDMASLGADHELVKPRSLAELRRFAQEVLDRETVGLKAKVSLISGDWSETYPPKADGTVEINISNQPQNRHYWTVLHEIAHALGYERSLDDFDNNHGPGFRDIFYIELLPQYGVNLRTAGLKAKAISGHPEIVSLIEDFKRQPLDPRHWGPGGWVTEMSDPYNAHGYCQVVSEQFVEFARARGFDASTNDMYMDEIGYTPTGGPYGEVLDENGDIVQGYYPEHTVAVITVDDGSTYGRDIYIDFTAAQYGYTDFPKVTGSQGKTASLEKTAADLNGLVYRGFPLTVDDEQHARALLAGGQVATDLLVSLVNDGGLGVWWTSEAGEVYSHAQAVSGDYDLSIKGAVEAADRGEGFYGAETSVVLAAAVPTAWEQEDWQVPEGSPIDLVSIKYTIDPMDDTAWRTVPVGRTLAAARMTPEEAADETAQEQHERSRDMFFLRNGTDGVDLGQHGGITYEFQGWVDTPWGTPAGRVIAFQGMSTVGSLEWIEETISSVWVAHAYRRQGIATRLLEHARALTPELQHSTLLTDDGRAWSEKVGSTSGLFWRVHPAGRPFGVEDATSTPFYDYPGSKGTQEGYSCFANAWHLWVYTMRMGWGRVGTDVIGFSGTTTGEQGGDGEDLAVPDMRTVRRMSWEEFERTVLSAEPFPATPAFARWVRGFEWNFLDSWEGVARYLAEVGTDGPAEEEIIRRYPQVRTAGANGDLPEDLVITTGPDEYFARLQPDLEVVIAWVGGERIGHLAWHNTFKPGPMGHQVGKIVSVEVVGHLQRRGIASAMLAKAREVEPRVHHSNALSEDGRAWVEKVGSLPSGIRFETTVMPDDLRQRQPIGGTVYAFLDGGNPEELKYPYLKDCVGILRWYSSGEIDSVWVHPDLRRQGLATDLLRRAREADPTVHHSETLTNDGRAWSQKVGSRPIEVHRGVNVEVDFGDEYPEEVVRAGRLGEYVLKALRGQVGIHWTVSRAIAEDFSDPMSRYAEPKRTRNANWALSVPVVVSATVDATAIQTDGEVLDDLMVQNYGWQGLNPDRHEEEITLKPGAAVNVTSIQAALPTDPEALAADLEAMNETGHVPSAWTEIAGSRQVTARNLGLRATWHRGMQVMLDVKDPRAIALLEALASGATTVARDRLIELMAGGSGYDPWTGNRNGPREGAGGWWTTDTSAAWTYATGIPMAGEEDDAIHASVILHAEISDEYEADFDGSGYGWHHLDPGTPLTITGVTATLPIQQQARLLVDLARSQGMWFDPMGMGGDDFVYPGLSEQWEIEERIYEWPLTMRTQASLGSSQAYFHGTSVALGAGTVIAPREPGAWEPGQPTRSPGERFSDPAVAYATTEESDAWHWAEHAWNAGRGDLPRVYRVRPLGEVHPDPNNEFAGDVVSPDGFEVVEEVTSGSDYDFWREGSLGKTAMADYWMNHRPQRPGVGVPSLDACATAFGYDEGDEDAFYRSGVDSFAPSADYSAEAVTQVRAARGKPDLLVDIYRAVPPGVDRFAQGDWVTLSRAYAGEHLHEILGGNGTVLHARVPARQVFPSGEWDVLEWGYWGVGARTAALERTAMADLMLNRGVFYRVHHLQRAFSVEDAWSAPLRISFDDEMDEPREGYSCYSTPWELWAYVALQSWTAGTARDEILIFSGDVVGEGIDGEPLVVPDHRVEQFISWRAFLDALAQHTGKFPEGGFVGGVGTMPWLLVAIEALQEDPSDPVAQRLMADAARDQGVSPQMAGEAFQMLFANRRTATHDVQGDLYLITDVPDAMDLVLDLSDASSEEVVVRLGESLDNVVMQFPSLDPVVTSVWSDGKFVSATARGWGYITDLAVLRERLALAPRG